MRIACDTNRYVDFARGLPDAVSVVRGAESIFIPVVVLGELRAGFHCGTKGTENERNLILFLSSSRVSILHTTAQTTHHYGQLFKQLRHQGTPIPTNDIWIAALVIEHNLALWDRDSHFNHLPQIPRV